MKINLEEKTDLNRASNWEGMPLQRDHLSHTSVVICGPPTSAIGGVPTHLRTLLGSKLAQTYSLQHFLVGSRGRESPALDEKLIAKVLRLILSPIFFFCVIAFRRPSIVHINTALDKKAFWRDAVLLLIAKLIRRRVVCQLHGGSWQTVCGDSRTLRRICHSILASADAVVVLSHIEKRIAEEFLRLSGVMVVPNAIDTSEYAWGRNAFAQRKLQRIAYVGRLAREKGLYEAIDAIGELVSSAVWRDLRFVIAGSGGARAELEQYVRRRGLTRNVEFVGTVVGREKVNLLHSADLFLLPSYSEGLPYSLIESLAAGTPVIATNVGSIPEVIEHGVHGFLVEPRDWKQIVDAIKRIAGDPALLGAMSLNCRKRAVEYYGLDRLAKQMDDVYRAVLQKA